MKVLVVTPPDLIVDLDLAKKHLRVTEDDEDDLIEGYCDAAQASIDGPLGWLGRCMSPQTLEAQAAGFDELACLPYGPVLSIDSVHYVNAGGVDTLLGEDIYQLVGDGIQTAPGKSWPTVRGDLRGVRVAYSAGFEPVPGSVRQAILLLISTWFTTRSAVVTGTIATDMPHGVMALLSPFRKLY